MQTKKQTNEIFSKTGLLTISVLLCISSITLVKADKVILSDLNNAIQHINEIQLIDGIHTGSTLIKKDSSLSLDIETDNFIITQSGNNSNIITDSKGANIIGGNGNEIYTSEYSTILGGIENRLAADYAIIGGGKSNIIQAGSKGATIIGGQDNKIATNSPYSTILGGNNNTISGIASTIAGNNNTLNGDYSVILGSNAILNGNRSFLWSDGNDEKTLNQNNVFAILGKNGMVINSSSANKYTKLTIGGSLIITPNNEKDKDISCGDGKGTGIIKFTGDSRGCFCVCNGSEWNSLLGDGACEATCRGEYNGLNPKCGTTYKEENINGKTYYLGSCENNSFPISDSYFMDKNNTLHRTCQTIDGSTIGCSAGGSNKGNDEIYSCATKPDNSNHAYIFNETAKPTSTTDTNWHYPSNSRDRACTFTCNEEIGYTYKDGKCVFDNTPKCNGRNFVDSDKTAYIRSSKAPTVNMNWSINTKISISKKDTWNTISAKLSACTFTCNNGYIYKDGECIKNTIEKTYSCEGDLPENHYKTNQGNINKNGIERTYDETLSSACTFKCEAGYDYINIEGEKRDCVQCVEGTKTENYCEILIECEPGYTNINNECYLNARCLDSRLNMEVFGVSNILQDRNDVTPYGKDKQITCKNNASEVTPNSCEYSCKLGYYCTPLNNCQAPHCESNVLYNNKHSSTYQNPTLDISDNYMEIDWTWVNTKEELTEKQNNNEKGCFYRCPEENQYKSSYGSIYCYSEEEVKEKEAKDKITESCKKEYHRGYDLEYENPSGPDTKREFVDYNTYQNYKNQGKEGCYRTCNTSISGVEQEPKTGVVSSEDYLVCRKLCNEDEKIESYGRCTKCPAGQIGDPTTKISGNATACIDQCTAEYGDDYNYNKATGSCSTSTATSACRSGWIKYKNTCVKCLNSTQTFDEELGKCV